jgi:hypothetical protein
MTVIVTHNKVSGVADSGDTTLVQPSDWNANHTISGLGTAASLDAGVANGVATLDAGGKVPTSQIPLQGDLNYQGAWNASTNSPTLTSSTGTKGYYYVVSVAGTTNLNGITDWQVGDWAIFNGSVWQKVDNTDAVTSVNGYVGTVVLTYSDVGAQPAGTYVTSVSATSPVTSTGGTTPTIAIPEANTSTNGYLTSTDWNTFNNKVSMVYPGAGIPNSTGTAWGTSYSTTGTGTVVALATGPTLSAPIIDGANPYIQFNNGSAVTVAAGKLWYDGSTGSWNAGMGGGNITQQIGEELFVYGKASSAITDSPLQIIYQTGAVGASGVIQFAPTVAGITNGDLILGVATESIALNGFGRVTSFGIVHGITTNGTAYGETWADGDTIWYNPVTGNPTNVKPSAPNIKVQIGTLIKAGSGGSGSIQVEINHGSVLGGTDSNVQLSSPTAAQILTYSTTDSYWKNTSLAAGTGISIGTASNGILTVTNSAPDQTVSISAGTGISVSGTYPSFTVANSGVTSIAGTASQITASASTGGVTLALANPINVDTSGNAATVTNGVYTTGSYSNPTWITSLAGSKISGTIDGGTF